MSEQRKQIEAARDGALKKFLRSEFFFNYRHNISAMIGTVIVVLILLIAASAALAALGIIIYKRRKKLHKDK